MKETTKSQRWNQIQVHRNNILVLLLVNKYIIVTINIMESIRQEDGLGCAVACIAFVLHIQYSDALALFHDGKRRVREEANFYCPEIVEILHKNGLSYKWQKIKKVQREEDFENYSIVFIQRSSKLPYGHFLTRYKKKWMDPWINLPEVPTKSGFRTSLPGIPTYLVFPH